MAGAAMNLCYSMPMEPEGEAMDSKLMEFDSLPRMAAPPAAQRKLGRVRAARSESAKAAAPAPLDLSAYRTRAAELTQRLESATDKRRELAVLRLRLEELLDDLTSVGAGDADRQPLAELLAALQAFPPSATDAEVAALAKQCADALTAFATGTPAKKRRLRWW